MKKIFLPLIAVLALFSSCENDDWEFDDYGTTSVYFAKQTPIRTITLGTDVYSTEMDNQHQCQVMAVMGGVYENRQDRVVSYTVDPTLVAGQHFADGREVKVLPESYYTLDNASQFTIPKGKVMGGPTVTLTDAFFNDPLAIDVNYVLPLRITSTAAFDTILTDKNHILYAVKYKNKWDGYWLSAGTDVITENGTTTTVTREPEYVEKYEVRQMTTRTLKQVNYPLATTVTLADGTTQSLQCNLVLTFDDNDNCTITTDQPGCTATGSGKWTFEGAKKAWGDKDRDLLELTYTVVYTYQNSDVTTATKKQESTDRLIARDRGSKLEEFSLQ